MKLNNKGQALVEFILILPILILVLFAIIDFGMIYTAKAKLENTSYEVVELLNNDNSIDEIRNIYNKTNINISVKDKYEIIKLEEKVKIITPGLSKIIGNPVTIDVERVIPYET